VLVTTTSGRPGSLPVDFHPATRGATLRGGGGRFVLAHAPLLGQPTSPVNSVDNGVLPPSEGRNRKNEHCHMLAEYMQHSM
jgi:hypothetical protein